MWQACRPISMQEARNPEINLPEGAGGRACTPMSIMSDEKGASAVLLPGLLELLVFPGLMEQSYAF